MLLTIGELRRTTAGMSDNALVLVSHTPKSKRARDKNEATKYSVAAEAEVSDSKEGSPAYIIYYLDV